MHASTVGDLLDFLATQPRDRVVVLSKNAEGDGYSPLCDVWEAMYEENNTWSGEVYMTPEDRAAQEDPDDWSEAPAAADRVVVLGPVN